MMVTKEDLNAIAHSYFYLNGVTPKHSFNGNDCDRFARNIYNFIVSIPSDSNAYRNLVKYVYDTTVYYGIDLTRAANWLKTLPGIQQTFLQYIHDNYSIETNGEIIQRLTGDAFKYVGNTISKAVWGLIKPLIPIALIGIGLIYLFTRSKKT